MLQMKATIICLFQFLYHIQLLEKWLELRKNGKLDWIRPDGKSQITFEYNSKGEPLKIDTVVISTQHSPDISQTDIENELMSTVCKESIPEKYLDSNTKFIINPSGQFIIGGPHGDAGLTGRKNNC